MVRQRIRIRFRKEGDLRLISHRDLVRLFERLLRRAELPLSMTEGYHPKPRMSFPLALALGIAGIDEVMELELAREYTSDELREVVTPFLPLGLSFTSIEVLADGAAKARVKQVELETPVPESRRAALQIKIDELLASSEILIERARRREPIDLRSSINALTLDGGTLRITLRVTGKGDARPREILACLGLDDLEAEGCFLTRSNVQIDHPTPSRQSPASTAT
jgi:radical SAM-linked protein